jgi:hypothetical protein
VTRPTARTAVRVAPPARDPEPPRSRPWLLPVAAVVALLCFVAAAGSTPASIACVVLVTAGVLTGCARSTRPDLPHDLALGGLLTVTVAFPFAQIGHDTVTSYAVVLSSLCMLGAALLRQPLTALPRCWQLVLALFLVLGVSSVFSPDEGAVKQLVVIAAAGLPAFLLAGGRQGRRLATVASVVVALAAAESVLAVCEPFLVPLHLWPAELGLTGEPAPVLANSLLPGLERSEGTLAHPLPLGLLIVLALALLVRVLPDVPLWLRRALTVLLLAGLVFSGDRNALLTAVGVLVLGARTSAPRLLTGAAVVGGAVLLLVDLRVLTAGLLDEFFQSGSYLHRLQAYRYVARLAYTQSPDHVFFGNGYASTPRMFTNGRLYDDGLHVVDNQFVLVQSQGGLICLLLLLAVVAAAALRCPPVLRPTLAAAVVVMLIFDVFLWPSATALTLLVLGAALGAQPPPAPTPSPPYAGRRRRS